MLIKVCCYLLCCHCKVERLLKPPPEVALAMELNARRRKYQKEGEIEGTERESLGQLDVAEPLVSAWSNLLCIQLSFSSLI